MTRFTPEELDRFHQNGFIAVPNLLGADAVAQMLQLTQTFVAEEIPPIEYEADLGYPGAPSALDSPGGRTIRRFRQAVARHPAFFEWAVDPTVLNRLRQLLGPDLVMPLAHHNCVMTKHPRYSSDTGWHQDIRYWRFQRPELISVLLALTDATETNGCLRFLPGTHRAAFSSEQLDENLFLRTDLPENQALIETAVGIAMQPGDAVFFHCRVFHAATRNRTQSARISVINTYRPADNPPIAGTRSAGMPELLLHAS